VYYNAAYSLINTRLINPPQYQSHIDMKVGLVRFKILTLSPLVIFLILMLSSSIAFNVMGQKTVESIYVDISGYIKREPWMRPGGTVRVPMMGEANTLNPFTLTTSWEFMIIHLIYDTLVIVTPDLKFVERLAEHEKTFELHVIPGSGHLITEPAKLAQLLTYMLLFFEKYSHGSIL
jgi:hypothetical protein